MKTGYIHVCFVIDKSGSMYGSEHDVIGGFNNMVNEQRNQKDGACSISLFQFDNNVITNFIGKNVNDIADDDFDYLPGGCTAMNDGIGYAIDEIGKWLCDMSEEERPEKNLIVIMTDGEENSSTKYSIDKVKEMIKHQTEKYNWSFMYLGTDITDANYSNDLGVTSAFGSKKAYTTHYSNISKLASNYRSMDQSEDYVTRGAKWNVDMIAMANSTTLNYEQEIGTVINSNTKNAI